MSVTARSERRLAAIMFVDMVGYTALSHRDEALALESLATLRRLVAERPAEFGGRLIKELGDGFLLEFPSTLAAVDCAFALRKATSDAKAKRADNCALRIGIHLGDVEHQNGDVFGHDVNLAQRVQNAAGPGELWFTEPVFQEVRSRYGRQIWKAGTRHLRHISRPVPLYCVPRPGLARTLAIALGRVAPHWIGVSTALFLLAALALVLTGAPQRFSRTSLPRVLILPFRSLPESSETRDFSSGLVQSLCSALAERSQAQGMQVMMYDEDHVPGTAKIGMLMNQWHANRALTGTVQRQGSHLRITVNLLDAGGSRVLNSAILDKQPDNLCSLQDELADRALDMLGLSSASVRSSVGSGRTQVASAYEAYLQGLGRLARYDRSENLDSAIADFQNAVRQDPAYALAFAGLAEAYWRKYDYAKVPTWKERASENLSIAQKLGRDLPRVRIVAGLIATGLGEGERALAEFKHVLQVDPGNTEVRFGLAQAYETEGQPVLAERVYRDAIARLPEYWAGYNKLGGFYVRLGNYPAAETCFKQAIQKTPDNYEVLANLGGLYYLMARYDQGAETIRRSIELRPTADAYCNLGMIRFFQGDYKDATKMFEEAVAMDNNNWLFWGDLADAYRIGGAAPAKALQAYRKAADLALRQLAINPRDNGTRALLATYYAGLGDTPAALQEIQLARQHGSADLQIIFLSALVHELAGQRQHSIQELLAAARGGYSPQEILRHPDLAALRSDPEFRFITNAFNSSKK